MCAKALPHCCKAACRERRKRKPAGVSSVVSSIELTVFRTFFSFARLPIHPSNFGGFREKSSSSNRNGNSFDTSLDWSVDTPTAKSDAISRQISLGTMGIENDAASCDASTSGCGEGGISKTVPVFSVKGPFGKVSVDGFSMQPGRHERPRSTVFSSSYHSSVTSCLSPSQSASTSA
ncbi:hypothetical protein OUZ56_033449 [Daphnia magna]|uniref:Uncharacterized protein n=1 Tax=Daphnia magna TaxID=35525 RepID=A0ABR0BAQ6_9CRUS|nr:hypothetical protein OUZ56_033449 [Daphnia magna]